MARWWWGRKTKLDGKSSQGKRRWCRIWFAGGCTENHVKHTRDQNDDEEKGETEKDVSFQSLLLLSQSAPGEETRSLSSREASLHPPLKRSNYERKFSFQGREIRRLNNKEFLLTEKSNSPILEDIANKTPQRCHRSHCYTWRGMREGCWWWRHSNVLCVIFPSRLGRGKEREAFVREADSHFVRASHHPIMMRWCACASCVSRVGHECHRCNHTFSACVCVCLSHERKHSSLSFKMNQSRARIRRWRRLKRYTDFGRDKGRKGERNWDGVKEKESML